MEHDSSNTLFRLLEEMRRRKLFCDAYLVGEDNVVVPVHKLILASRVYLLLGYSEETESVDSVFSEKFVTNNSSVPIVHVKGYTHDKLDALIRIAYVGNLLQISIETKINLCHLLLQISSFLNINVLSIIKSEKELQNKLGLSRFGVQRVDDRSGLKGEGKCTSSDRHELSCHICGRTFPKKYILQNHLSLHNMPNYIKEDILANFLPDHCPKSDFSRKKNEPSVLANVRENSPEKMKCNECDRDFSSLAGLRRHLKQHIREPEAELEKPDTSWHGSGFSCPCCGKVFKTRGNMKRHHSIIHEGIKKFCCTLCDSCFGQKVSFDLHLATVHKVNNACVSRKLRNNFIPQEIETGSLRCCDQSSGHLAENSKGFDVSTLFAASEPVLQHVEMDGPEVDGRDQWVESTTCMICGKQLSRPSNLKKHMLIHKETKELDAVSSSRGSAGSTDHPISTESSASLRSLVISSTVTDQLRIKNQNSAIPKGGSFVCHKCGKKFLLAEYLKRHVSDVHCLAEFACAHCPKKFNSAVRLKRHQVVHARKTCDRCKGTFEGERAFNNHLKTSCEDPAFSVHDVESFLFVDPLVSSILLDADLERHCDPLMTQETRSTL